MAITDYGTLRTAVANYLHRQDLTANIPDFISMAEWRVARALRVSQLLTDTTIAVAAGGSTAALPTGFMELVNCRIASGAELHYTPPDCIDRVTDGTVPWTYTLSGSTIVLAPAWSLGGSIEVRFWQKPTALSDTVTSNWYVANAPDALLYGSLLEAAPYIQGDARIPVWQQFFDQSISALNAQYGNVDPHKRQLAYQQPDRNAGADLRNVA